MTRSDEPNGLPPGLPVPEDGGAADVLEGLDLPPFDLLSDERLDFAKALGLPAFEVGGMILTKRLTMIVRDGRIEKVFHPVFPPDKNADEVVEWLSARATT